MAAIDFPNSPVPGQVFNAGDRSWVWTGTVWDAYGPGTSTFFPSPTPPTSPTAGDIWFDTNTGRSYIWYDSTWVEMTGAPSAGTAALTSFTPTGSIAATNVQAAIAEVALEAPRMWVFVERLRTALTGSTVPQMMFQSPLITPRSPTSRFFASANVNIGANAAADDTWIVLDAGPGVAIPGPSPTPGVGYETHGYWRFQDNATMLEVANVKVEAEYSPGNLTPFNIRVCVAVRTTAQLIYLNKRGADNVIGTVSSIAVYEIA